MYTNPSFFLTEEFTIYPPASQVTKHNVIWHDVSVRISTKMLLFGNASLFTFATQLTIRRDRDLCRNT